MEKEQESCEGLEKTMGDEMEYDVFLDALWYVYFSLSRFCLFRATWTLRLSKEELDKETVTNYFTF